MENSDKDAIKSTIDHISKVSLPNLTRLISDLYSKIVLYNNGEDIKEMQKLEKERIELNKTLSDLKKELYK